MFIQIWNRKSGVLRKSLSHWGNNIENRAIQRHYVKRNALYGKNLDLALTLINGQIRSP